MQGKLIRDKMSETYMEELGCKHPISWVVVTATEVVKNVTFIHLKMPTQPAKIVKEGDEQWVNDTLSRLNLRN
jgi:hypothetical protein